MKYLVAAFALLAWPSVQGAAAVQGGETEAAKQQWLAENATVVKSVNLKDGDFSDLMPLAGKIADARVVMLGEISHSDGTTFRAKNRLIRFLHETMGFDVLVWESGLYDCRVFDAALSSDRPLDEVAHQGVFSIWTRTAEVRQLMEYARRTRSTVHPLEMAGMDCQFSSKESVTTYPAAVFDFFDRVDRGILSAADRELFQSTVKWLADGGYRQETEQSKKFQVLLQRLRQALKRPEFVRMHGLREVRFTDRTLRNADELVRLTISTALKAGWHIDGLNVRNRTMGENLAWLARTYYPDRKLIVWAASNHLSRNGGRSIEPTQNALMNERFKTLREAGDAAIRELGAGAIYSIGFSGYEVETVKAPAGSFDDLCHRTGHDYLFVDLKGQPRNHWLRQPMSTRIYGAALRADWSSMFDGIFFMDVVHNSTPVEQDIAP